MNLTTRSIRLVVRAVAIASAAIAIHWLCIRPYLANRVLKRVEIRSHEALEAGDWQRAMVLARKNLDELRPIGPVCRTDVNYHLLSAVNAQVLDRPAEALEHFDAALRADQRPEIYFDRGMTLLALGRTVEAIPDFAMAARFHPGLIESLDPVIREQISAYLRR